MSDTTGDDNPIDSDAGSATNHRQDRASSGSTAETADAGETTVTEDRAGALRDKARTTLDDLGGSVGAAPAGSGVGQFLWWAIGLIAAILLLALLAAQCGADDDEVSSGGGLSEAPVDNEGDGGDREGGQLAGSEAETADGSGGGDAGTSGDRETSGGDSADDPADQRADDTADEGADDSADERAGDTADEGAGGAGSDSTEDLQAAVDQALATTGVLGLVGTVDGDTVAVTGQVASQAELEAVEVALAELGLAAVDNQVVVTGTGTADGQSASGAGDPGGGDDEADQHGSTSAAGASGADRPQATPVPAATESDPDFTG